VASSASWPKAGQTELRRAVVGTRSLDVDMVSRRMGRGSDMLATSDELFAAGPFAAVEEGSDAVSPWIAC
jgi:hypothetical protein